MIVWLGHVCDRSWDYVVARIGIHLELKTEYLVELLCQTRIREHPGESALVEEEFVPDGPGFEVGLCIGFKHLLDFFAKAALRREDATQLLQVDDANVFAPRDVQQFKTQAVDLLLLDFCL